MAAVWLHGQPTALAALPQVARGREPNVASHALGAAGPFPAVVSMTWPPPPSSSLSSLSSLSSWWSQQTPLLPAAAAAATRLPCPSPFPAAAVAAPSSPAASASARAGANTTPAKVQQTEQDSGTEQQQQQQQEYGVLAAAALQFRDDLLGVSALLDDEQEDAGGSGSGNARRGSRGRRGRRTDALGIEVDETPESELPKVAIIGRPNVGKSALFNRIAGKELAIVHDEPGVTRDRRYTRAFWSTREFLVADTGGVLTPPPATTSSSRAASPSLASASSSLASDLFEDATDGGERGGGRRAGGDGGGDGRGGRSRGRGGKGGRGGVGGSVGADGIAVTAGGGQEAVAAALREAAAAGLPSLIEKQAAAAVEEADVVVLVVDGQAGPTAADVDIAAWLRRQHPGKPKLLAVNKCESPTKGLVQAAEFWSLGLTPMAVSAISGSGTGDLLDAVCEMLPKKDNVDAPTGVSDPPAADKPGAPLAIAIVGRPNVGKSSLMNAVLGEERTIVSPISGTTRDAIDTLFNAPDGTPMKLIDTAGIRRRTAVAAADSRAEALSIARAFRAIRSADVVAIVIDAMQCVTEQDFRLGERIEREGKACVIVVNKWDTVPDKDEGTSKAYELDVRERLRSLLWAPIIYTTAAVGVDTPLRVSKLLEVARRVGEQRAKRLSTATLNAVVAEAVSFRPLPHSKAGRVGRIYYCTQAATNPPTFVFFVNDAKLFNEDYRRYMEKHIRQNVDFEGTPIRLLWRSKKKRAGPPPAGGAGGAAGGAGGGAATSSGALSASAGVR